MDFSIDIMAQKSKTLLAIIPGIPDGEECYNISVEGKADLPESS